MGGMRRGVTPASRSYVTRGLPREAWSHRAVALSSGVTMTGFNAPWRIRYSCAHADDCEMTEKKRRPAKKRGGPVHKSPYFLQPGKLGAVTVLRRPAGNRIDAKLCGTMSNRAMALALVKQLEKAESVVKDLFLEATDDGIEALDAVLEACRESVIRRGELAEGGHHPAGAAAGARKRGRSRRRGPATRPRGAPPASGDGAEGTSAA